MGKCADCIDQLATYYYLNRLRDTPTMGRLNQIVQENASLWNDLFEKIMNSLLFNKKSSDYLSRPIHSILLVDINVAEHYFEAKEGITETNEYKLSAFFHGKLLISYAIQYKKNPRTVYYYDALGHLKYIDMISENYPNFPYWSKQYKVNGKMISAIYFVSHDMQYMYEPDGEFQGVWFMDKRYDRNAKQDLTRTNW